VLKEAGRSATEHRSDTHYRNLLTIGETALAMALLVGAGLLFKSFLRVRRIDPGFKSEGILSLTRANPLHPARHCNPLYSAT
jgi:hypothetical protein